MAESDDILAEGKRLFTLAEEAESDNRKTAEDDITFAREGKQWPSDVAKQREDDERPMLTINKLPAFIRQVVNDARMNKPSVKVHPADSGADPDTAELLDGLIRNIEYTSNADVAYDTAIESAVSGGFGYWRVGVDYSYHDSFDLDLSIKRVANPFSVYGDPNSLEADSSDWMNAFVVERYSKADFEAKYGKDNETYSNWDNSDAFDEEAWREGNERQVAEWWSRKEEQVKVQQFVDVRSNRPITLTAEQLASDEDIQMALQLGLLQFKRERDAKLFKVKQRIMSGSEVINARDWPGCYIPIIPVYGDEINIKGKRLFRSLIHPAIDAQRMFNYWRTTSTELVALSPRVPFIGPEGTFDNDPNWQTANTRSHPYLEYVDKGQAPQRQSLDSGPAAGALQEALNASDDMKAILGIYDASLGARSNETSGRAIMARQREGDVSTFHFIDNLSRAIRHTGRILIDLIPHVYSGERIVRVMGEDGTPEAKTVNAPYPKVDPKTGQPVTQPVMGPNGQPEMDPTTQQPLTEPVLALHDLSAGKYDVTVTTGPSFTTRREEAAFQMTEIMRALPMSAPIVGKHLAKNMDWPGADDIAEELDQIGKPQVPPEMQQMIEEGKAEIARLTEENQSLKMDRSIDQAKLQADIQQANVEAENKVKIALIDIEAEKQIAMAKIEAQKEIDAYKAGLQAQVAASRPQPQRTADA